MRPYLTDSLPWNVWPNVDFRDELLILVKNDDSIDSSAESQRLRSFFKSSGISFQSLCHVPPTDDLELVDDVRDGMVESEELTDKDEALNRAVHRLRRVRFHELLSIEAQRLNCSTNEVLTLDHHSPSDSTNPFLLTQDILRRVLDKLELIDLVRLSGVCRGWRTLVRGHVSQVERLEYCVSTHLLRFRNWLHHTRFSKVEWLRTSWDKTALELTLWTTNLALNLKTLIVNWPIAWDDFVVVSERCLKLKHFICEYVDALFIAKLHHMKPQFIAQLECLVLQHSGCLTTPYISILDLSVHASMTVYSITQRSEDESTMVTPYFRMGRNWWEAPIRWLQQIPCFRLKYLRLRVAFLDSPKEAVYLGRCLEHCPELLVLILEDQALFGHNTLTAIAKECTKLKVLWIAMSVLDLDFIEELVGIYQSLSRYDPGAEFEEFHFVLCKEQFQTIKNRVPFNLIDRTTNPKLPDRLSVKHPFIKNILGTPF